MKGCYGCQTPSQRSIAGPQHWSSLKIPTPWAVTSHLTHQGRLGGIAMLDSTMATKRNRDVPKRNGGQKTKNRCLWRTYLLGKNGLNLHLDPAPEPSHFHSYSSSNPGCFSSLKKAAWSGTCKTYLKVLLWQLWRSTLKKRVELLQIARSWKSPTVPIAHWNSKVHALKPTHFTGPPSNDITL